MTPSPARPFRFAVQAMGLGDREAVVAAARQAEDLGYEELYSFDHLGTVDPFVPLLVAAEATARLRVGPLVLNNELHHPVLLARTVATVDRMTSGRVVLGMGTGYAQAEHDAAGIDLRPPRARVERLEESLLALRALLDDGAVQMDGRHHHLAVADLGVRPVQSRVPLLLGGHGRQVVRLGGQLADIFQFTGLTHAADGTPQPGGFRPEAVAVRARWLREAAGERDGAIERSVLVQRTFVRSTTPSALEEAARVFELPPDLLDSTPFVLAGEVGHIVDRLEQLRESFGISHVVIREPDTFAPVVAALAGR